MKKEDSKKVTISPYERLSGWFEIGTDLVLLNLLWLGCCLPIVTIGASTTAMHYVARKMATGEGYKVAGSFFHSFRENWKQGTLLGVFVAALALIGIGDFYAGTVLGGTSGMLCQVIGILTALAAFVIGTVGFPVLARYQLGITQVVKNAFLLGVTNPLVILAHAAVLAILPAAVLLKESMITWAVPIGILFLGGTAALVIEALLKKVFAKLEGGAEHENNSVSG